MYYFKTDELSHHGILGQKWGVRRFQNKDGSLTASGKKRYDENDSEEKKKGLTDKQKAALIIGASVTAGIIVGYGAYRLHELDKLKKAGIDAATGLQLKDKIMTADQDMKAVNLGRRNNPFKNLKGEYSHNCALCSMTYEARRRGFDVKAGEEKVGKTLLDVGKVYGLDQNQVLNRTKQFQQYNTPPSIFGRHIDPSYNDMISEIKRHGNGARGTIHVSFDKIGGGGHSMIWENNGGKVVLRDCQTNKKYTGDALKMLFGYTRADCMMRTDDLKMDPKLIRDWVRSSSELDHGTSEFGGLMKTTTMASLAGAGSYSLTRGIQKGDVKIGKQRQSNAASQRASSQNGTYYKRNGL